ncbi:MAG: hypothetical protein L0206_03795 [Actinobacteria bacterium]|nr:hypothetical protein [Actinomycetota bacterium]
MERVDRRLIDRIADASVLLPTLLGAPCDVGHLLEHRRIDSRTWGVFAIYVAVTGVLHVWFRPRTAGVIADGCARPASGGFARSLADRSKHR